MKLYWPNMSKFQESFRSGLYKDVGSIQFKTISPEFIIHTQNASTYTFLFFFIKLFGKVCIENMDQQKSVQFYKHFKWIQRYIFIGCPKVFSQLNVRFRDISEPYKSPIQRGGSYIYIYIYMYRVRTKSSNIKINKLQKIIVLGNKT